MAADVVRYQRLADGDDDGLWEDKNKDEKKSIEISLSDNVFTVEDAIEHCGFGWFQIRLSVFAGLIWMVDAMEIMLLSVLAPEARCYFNLTHWQEALITTTVFCGMLVGSLLWGKMMDKWGRKRGLFLAAIWTSYFAVLSAFSSSYAWLLFLRCAVGLGVSGSSQAVTYYAEFLPMKSRAYCLVLLEAFFITGTMLEVVLAIIVMPRLDWHWLLGLSAVPLIIDLLAFKFVPESARYYVTAGQLDKARDVVEQVARINGKKLPCGRLISSEEKQHMKESQTSQSQSTSPQLGDVHYHSTDTRTRPVCQTDDESSPSVGETSEGNRTVSWSNRGSFAVMFSSTKLGLSTIILWNIWFGLSFAYYGVVLLTTEMLSVVKEKSNNSIIPCIEHAPVEADHCVRLEQSDYVTLLWTAASEVPGLLITALMIERIGRKKTIAVELAGCSAMFLLMLICPIHRDLFMMFAFFTRALVTGAFQAAYVYTPEVYPTNVRGLGLGCCTAAGRLGAIATPFIAQVLLRVSMSGAKGTYAAVALLCSAFAILLPIETKGKSMEEQVGH